MQPVPCGPYPKPRVDLAEPTDGPALGSLLNDARFAPSVSQGTFLLLAALTWVFASNGGLLLGTWAFLYRAHLWTVEADTAAEALCAAGRHPSCTNSSYVVSNSKLERIFSNF